VGFSGDVNGLTWQTWPTNPIFSATAANVGHPFWSHDIEGPPSDEELYTRWIQIGAFSGVMRSHDRGMSAGGCANDKSGFSCSIVEPWNVPQAPGVFNMEANRLALRMREELVPYIYNGHRSAFETGVGIIIPMYYFFPELDDAYLMTQLQTTFSTCLAQAFSSHRLLRKRMPLDLPPSLHGCPRYMV
jgi:alpha-glucosidase (family GH31 glycosyl hydrolase)